MRGVASTGLVHQLLSAGADSQLRFWRLKTGQLLQSVTLDAPAARLVLHRERWVWCRVPQDDAGRPRSETGAAQGEVGVVQSTAG